MISAEKIFKKYKKPVLSGVSLNISKGEVVGIGGENGSGKSTLLSVLGGFIKADSGEVKISGTVGYVPQETALFDNLSVKDNLRFWASAYNVPYDGVSIGEMIGDDYINKKVRHLSGGMKKRLSIALASLHNPDCLIMDEPTAALDIGFKRIMAQLIEDMRANGKAVIFTSHQPDELLWCDRVYILRGGKFVYAGEPEEMGSLSEVLYGSV